MDQEKKEGQAEAAKNKVSLQEAVKQQLANKKNQLAAGSTNNKGPQAIGKMKSQQSNKVMNQRRRMGAK